MVVNDASRAGFDTGLVACVAGFLLGILASTLWVTAFDGVLQLVGLAVIVAGLGVCFLEMRELSDVGALLDGDGR